MTDPTRLSIAEAGAAFRAGTLTAVDLAQAQLARIAALNPHIHAFVAVTPDLAQHDAIATANALSTAPPFTDFAAGRAVWTAMRTLPFNITGHPVLALPIGFSNNLPLGIQLIGADHSEATLCQIGDAYERATDHAAQRPRF